MPKGFQHLKMTVADVHTQDITPYFNPSYDYIEEARLANQGQWSLLTLHHCTWSNWMIAGHQQGIMYTQLC